MELALVDLDPENWRNYSPRTLTLAAGQEDLVADPTMCLARAYAYRDFSGRAVGIACDGVPAGLAMTRTTVNGDFVLEELLVAATHQRRGIGRWAATTLIEQARAKGLPRTWVTVLDGNEASFGLFASLGFVRRPEHDWEHERALCLEHA